MPSPPVGLRVALNCSQLSSSPGLIRLQHFLLWHSLENRAIFSVHPASFLVRLNQRLPSFMRCQSTCIFCCCCKYIFESWQRMWSCVSTHCPAKLQFLLLRKQVTSKWLTLTIIIKDICWLNLYFLWFAIYNITHVEINVTDIWARFHLNWPCCLS